jgi:hypothetical protein
MSLGGKQTSTSSLDPAMRDAALANLDMARAVGQLGFTPYKGPVVAGMSPGEIAAMQATNLGAAAFGLPQSAVPTGEDMSSYGLYERELANMAPGQRAFIEAMFINPMTGAAPTMTFNRPVAAPQPAARPSSSRSGSSGSGMTGGGGSFASSAVAARMPGGVNTRNPNSLINRVAAAAAGRPSAPTAANRPKARPTR